MISPREISHTHVTRSGTRSGRHRPPVHGPERSSLRRVPLTCSPSPTRVEEKRSGISKLTWCAAPEKSTKRHSCGGAHSGSPFGLKARPHLPSPHGVLSTPVGLNSMCRIPAHVHLVPSTALASFELRGRTRGRIHGRSGPRITGRRRAWARAKGGGGWGRGAHAAMAESEIDSRRQPTVPIALVCGHVSPAARMAEFQACHSQRVDGLTPSGGGSRLGGG